MRFFTPKKAIKMKKISVYLKDNLEKQLKQEAAKQERPLSDYASELIELALRIKSMQQDESRQKEEELMRKMPEQLLRLLNICSETFRCTFDEKKVRLKGENADNILQVIKDKATAYVDGFTGKEQS